MLNSGISNIKVFACNPNKTLANAIADKLGLKLGDCEVEKFSDGEISVKINENHSWRRCIHHPVHILSRKR